MKIKKVAYTYMIGDLFHYGHLNLLQQAKLNCDYHITGVITDKIAEEWQALNISNYKERKAIIESIKIVDEVVKQDSMDPTDNLKSIHKKFPGAKIILFQGHQEWGEMPGVSYVKSINGQVIRPKYYPSLSREKIIKLFKNYEGNKDGHFETPSKSILLGNLNHFDSDILTKGDTLRKFTPLLTKSNIEKLFIFTIKQWQANTNKILDSIKIQFRDEKVIVRSSALIEDSINQSYAGAFKSVLNIYSTDRISLKNAINSVIKSYGNKVDKNKQDQVLIQKQTESVKISGVIFTRNLEKNTPYYMINYDDQYGKTDLVTSGLGGKRVEILRSDKLTIPKKWSKLIEAVKEIESLLSGLALDIEFGINKNNKIIIFQIRPLAANLKYNKSSDDEIFRIIQQIDEQLSQNYKSMDKFNNIFSYSDMAFWNPSELIGDRPNYLDFSLFNNLIMKSNWNKSLIKMGYTSLKEELMIMIAGKPYINIPFSLYSLLPNSIHDKLKMKLLKFYYKKLSVNPELHDKIEFEIVHDSLDFSFDDNIHELENNGFTKIEIQSLKDELLKLTNNIIINSNQIFNEDELALKDLTHNRNKINIKTGQQYDFKIALQMAKQLLDDVNLFGINQFCRVARMAFIGRRIILSSENKNHIDINLINNYWASFPTIITEMKDDLNKLNSNRLDLNSFLRIYGHLRPGTYDITSLPYEKFHGYIINESTNRKTKYNTFNDKKFFQKDFEDKLDTICLKNKFGFNGKELLEFSKKATQLREKFKFEYTKNISLALELIAQAGDSKGYSRKQLSNLDMDSLFIPTNNSLINIGELMNIWDSIIMSRIAEKSHHQKISLPSIIFSKKDIKYIKHLSTKPNFISNEIIVGEIINLDEIMQKKIPDISNKIIMIKNADPGYDWIFTKNILGLITMYGGVASHMAIRCSELKIPAAIGCGEIYFNRFKTGDKVQIDCNNKKLICLF